ASWLLGILLGQAFGDLLDERLLVLDLEDGWRSLGLSGLVDLLLRLDGGVAVEVGVGEEARGRARVVEDAEEKFSVVVANPGSAANDLLEVRERVDDAHENDVLDGGSVHSGREHLGSRQDDGRSPL